jgi:hypothetical protein
MVFGQHFWKSAYTNRSKKNGNGDNTKSYKKGGEAFFV